MTARPGAFAGVELVIFDFDGVVADSEVISLSTLQETMAEFGVSLSLNEVRRRFLGTSLTTIFDFIGDGDDEAKARFRDIWRGSLFRRFATELTPVPHVLDFLDRLDRAGLRYCIASSGSHERISTASAAMQIEGRIPKVFSAEQVARGKPAPDLFLHAAAHMGTAVEKCFVIEDSPYGILAAKAAGMRAAGFVGGAHLSDIPAEHGGLLSEKGAERIWRSFTEAAAELG